uniref:Aspartic peptidase DDI1-type domain-containing protein n=1 Tax=Fagus sylvatica TaxID=28930 RepID=A0A2N9HC76_FAGSY
MDITLGGRSLKLLNGNSLWRRILTEGAEMHSAENPTPGMDQVPWIPKTRTELVLPHLVGSRGVNAIFREEPMEACRVFQEIDHTTSDCKSLSQFLNVPEEKSAIIQHKVPPKYKDLGCPTISCTIGEYLVERALLDLGVSINLLSFTVYQKMGLGDLKPTSITLQLADRSVRTPRGMIEDVLIKIENFYYLVDFIILDTEPTLHLDNGIPIILDSSQVLEEEQAMAINEPWRPHFEELPKTEKKPMPSSEEIPQLELKPLPNGFKYAYLGPGETFPVVISAALNVV